MSPFDKERHDVSLIFLAYLAFLGNSTKVAIALGIQPEVVEVLAVKENWEAKLDTYMGLRHEHELPERDKAIRRTVNQIQARHLQAIIQRVMEHVYQRAEQDSLIDWISPRDPRSNKSKLNVRILCNLIRAFSIASRIVAGAPSKPKSTSPVSEETSERERQTFSEAMRRAMESMDRLPGIDSVALAKETLDTWKPGSDSKEKQ